MRFRSMRSQRRRGVIAVMAAAVLVMIFAFTAFTVDLGYIALTRSQLQTAADAAALGACAELIDGLGSRPSRTPSEAAAKSRTTAEAVGASNRTADRTSVSIDPQADVEFGTATWNAASRQWQITWGGSGPYTAVRVTVQRGAAGRGDPLPLFLAPVIGNDTATVTVQATAALQATSGFHIPPGNPQKAPFLPYACDAASWEQLEQGLTGTDQFAYDPDSRTVSTGGDGVRELNIYPIAGGGAPGNRGIVSLGAPNSSATNVSRWIREGVNADDLAYFGGALGNDHCPLQIDGTPGMKASLEADLEAIIGQPRVMPLFSEVSGNGTNAVYTIVRFVGVRVVDVDLSGGQKRLVVQPAAVADETAILNGNQVTTDFWNTPRLVN